MKSRATPGRERLLTLAAIAAVAALGLACKFHSGPGSGWTVAHGAGLMYALFWTLAAHLVWPWPGAAWPIALAVFAACCLVEVSQLWQPAWLTPVRESFIGGAMLGATFSLTDIPHYAIGCAAGWAWIRRGTGRWR